MAIIPSTGVRNQHTATGAGVHCNAVRGTMSVSLCSTSDAQFFGYKYKYSTRTVIFPAVLSSFHQTHHTHSHARHQRTPARTGKFAYYLARASLEANIPDAITVLQLYRGAKSITEAFQI